MSAQEQENQIHEKTVSIVAYDSDEEYSDLRKWAQEVTGLDTVSEEINVNEDWFIVFDFGWSEREKKLSATDYQGKTITEAQEELKDNEYVSLEHRTETERKHKNSLASALRQFKQNDIVTGLPNNLSGGMELNASWGWWKTEEDDDWYVKIKTSSFDERRVLSKEEKRQSDDMYETIHSVPSLKFEVKMRSPNETRIEQWTDEVVAEMVKILSSNEAIGKVRFVGCTTRKEQEGECYAV